MRRRSLAFAVALAVVAAAHAAQPIPVVNEGGIRDKWMLQEGVPLVAPQYPEQFKARGDSVCVGMGYLVNADGTLSDFTLLKGWNSAAKEGEPEAGYWKAFAEASGAALSQWRLKPRPEVSAPQPVFTVGTFVFGADAKDPALRAHCRIPNLVAYIRDLSSVTYRRRPPPILARLDLEPGDPDEYRRRQAQMD